MQLAKFKIVIKCHWTKGKGFHKDHDGPSDDDAEENEDDDDEKTVLQVEQMEDE